MHTFHVVHEAEAAQDPPSRLSFEIEPLGEVCRLTVVHEEVSPATARYTEGGWATIFSGLKTFLETGDELRIGSVS